MCNQMKNSMLLISLIVLLPVLANLYVFVKLEPLYVGLESQDVSGGLRDFAARVESGELSNNEIASRLEGMASGADKVASGLEGIRIGYYFWMFSVLVIAVLQGMLIKKLLKTHNKARNPTASPPVR